MFFKMNKQKTIILFCLLFSLVFISYFNLFYLNWDHYLLMIAFSILSIITIKQNKLKHLHWYYYNAYFTIFLLLSLFKTPPLINLLVLISFYVIGRLSKIPLLTIMIILLSSVYIFTDFSPYTFDLGCLICILGLRFNFKNTGLAIIDDNKQGPFI